MAGQRRYVTGLQTELAYRFGVGKFWVKEKWGALSYHATFSWREESAENGLKRS